MARYPGVLLIIFLPLFSLAAENPSALNAMKVLPKEEVRNLARIVAYDGTPVPERWHFLVHDPSAASGVREYVVAGGELVSARGVSQFADRLTESDVIKENVVQIDSGKLAQLAKECAAANDVTLLKVSYQLQQEGPGTEPLWKVNCIGETDKSIGTLVVAANTGTILSHQGFALGPKTARVSSEPEPSSEKVAVAAKKRSSGGSGKKKVASGTASNVSRRGMAEPPIVAEGKPKKTIGDFFRKIFTGNRQRNSTPPPVAQRAR